MTTEYKGLSKPYSCYLEKLTYMQSRLKKNNCTSVVDRMIKCTIISAITDISLLTL
jgi:hypothetical protein